MITFRDFLYLDSSMLRNYLSTVEGYIEDEVNYAEQEKKQKGGKAGAKIVEGSLSSEKLREVKSRRTLTEPALFQRLYDLLEELGQLQYVDAFDETIWQDLKRGEILEVQAIIRVPSFLVQMEQIQEFSSLVDLVQAFGEESLSESDLAMLSGIGDLQSIIDSKPFPIVFQAASTPEYSFVAELSREYISGDATQLQGEAVVFGKIQRILRDGQKMEAFSLLPDLSALQSMNRQQRRALQSKQNKQRAENLVETVEGPAIVLTPLAVYR